MIELELLSQGYIETVIVAVGLMYHKYVWFVWCAPVQIAGKLALTGEDIKVHRFIASSGTIPCEEHIVLASCPWGPANAHRMGLLTELYVIYMERSIGCSRSSDYGWTHTQTERITDHYYG